MNGAATPVRKKLVIVGDGACGKTCLLVSYINGEMPSSYVPTVFETHITDVFVDGLSYELSLWDTAGQDAYDRLRPLSYPDTDVMLVCFSVDQPDSLQNTYDKWVPEVRHFCPSIPVVMVCTKVDLRDNDDVKYRLLRVRQSPVTTEQGLEMAKKLRAAAYVECSSRTLEGINEVFDVAIRAARPPVTERASKKIKKMKKLRCGFL